MSLELTRHGCHGEAHRADDLRKIGIAKDDTPSKSPGKSHARHCIGLPLLLIAEVRQHRRLIPLAMAQLLLLADQPLLPANMSQVAKEFHFDGPQRDEMLGGIVAIVFFTSGALFSLIAGRLADLMKRTTLVSGCMLLGAAGTFANSRVQNFSSLLVCRGAVGAALGGLLPASFAIVGDMYPADERPHAIAMMAVISGLGPALGQGLAGFLGSSAGWRAPFALVGAAGLLMSLLLFALQKELREVEQDMDEESRRYCGALCSALKKRTVILTCLQGIFGCVPWAVISTFLTDYLATNAHLGVPGATAVLFSFGIGCFAGTAVGGPKPIPPRIECRTAVDHYESKCLKNVKWIKNTGIAQHPEWYPGLTAQSPVADIQTAAAKSGHSDCNLEGCEGDKMECLPDDCGCLDEAVNHYNNWIGKYPAAADCKEPQMSVNGHCVCPPNMVPDRAEKCKMPKEPLSMTFYMYRAQSDYCYHMENVNLGDLAGVMWYLHKEVIASVPRKYNVTRILRYLVTVKNPQKTFEHEQYLFNGDTNGKQFGPFGAFDNSRCTATHCASELEEFGNAVGCQAVETMYYNYKRQAPATYCDPPDSPECVSGTWYSLVGACPLESLYKKTDECKQQYPSSRCHDPDGTPGCTYAVRYAGQVSLDEFVGIPNYETWWQNGTAPTGNIEYEVTKDRGNGTTFWNDRLSKSECSSRMQQVLGLFAKRYPSLPKDLPDPPCL